MLGVKLRVSSSFRGLDLVLQSNLDDVIDIVLRDNWDWLLINSGIERGGKSSFSLFQAKYASAHGLKFDWSPALKHVFFYERNLSEKMMNIPDKSVVIIDEGGEVLFSRKAIENEVIKIIQTLMIYGSKNILLIINIPDWRWIDKYIRLARVRSLAHIKTQPYLKEQRGGGYRMKRARGYYDFYTRKQVIAASRNTGNQPEGVLDRPRFAGRTSFFGSFYGKEWGWYSKKKTAFLEEKKKKKATRERKRTVLSSKNLPSLKDLDLFLEASK